MTETGIIRRIDDLGRVVIPKEIRRQMRLKENDPMELFLHEDGVFIRKWVDKSEQPEKLEVFMKMLMKEAKRNSLINLCDSWGISCDEMNECEKYLKTVLSVNI